MVQNIIKFSIENKLLVAITALLISVAGAYTLQHMDMDVFPDLTAPTVVVMTEAHGMAPEEVERLVSFPIETAVNGATGIRRVRSSSAQGFSLVWVEFDWDMDVYNARQIVGEKLQTVAGQLPTGSGTPTLMPQASIMGEIFIMALTADSMSKLDMRTIADWNIRPRLLSVNGVAQVTVFSSNVKEYQVQLNPGKMDFYNIGLAELVEILTESNNNVPGGYLEQHGNRYTIRGLGRASDTDVLGRRIIGMHNGIPVRLHDVANVVIGAAPTIGVGSYNGEEAAIILVTKQPNINTLALSADIQKTIEELRQSLPSTVRIHTDIFKQEDFIKSSIDNVSDALIEGGILVSIILFLFLMNVRVTVISLVSIPVSLFATVLCLKALGLGINTMVLGGMAIAIGSLVDDAIVDVENVYKRLRQNAALPAHERQSIADVVFHASVEIRSSIVNATFIIIAAFVPLFFLSGMEGRMLLPLGLTYVISLFASLIIAMTLTTVLAIYLLGNEKKLVQHSQGSWLERKLTSWYAHALHHAMNYRKLLLGTVVAMLGISLVLLSTYGRSFLPDFNEGTLTINTTTLPGISFEESNRTATDVEKALLALPEISVVERRTGRAELAEHSAGLNVSEYDVPYVLHSNSKEEFMSAVRAKLDNIPGITYEVGQPLGHRINHMLSGTKAAIAIKIFGANLQTMYNLGTTIKEKIRNVDGIVDLMVEQQVDIPQIAITPKEDVLAAYGIPLNQFLQFVDIGFAGETVGNVFENERNFPVVVRFQGSERESIEALQNALIATPTKGSIPFGYVANIRSTSGPNNIERENVKRKLVVSANVSGRDVRSVVEDIRTLIDKDVQLPAGYYIEYGGQFESEEKASRTLVLASLLSLLVIFMLLYQEFQDTKTTLVILLNLPLALIGGVFAILVTSGELNIPAIIGFITLFGIATRNGILLISRYNALLSEGYSLHKAIMDGSVDRLLPILMTALTAALALIPMALASDKAGNEIQSPMAIVILGGLLSSTFLNVFVLPIVFWFKEKNREVTV